MQENALRCTLISWEASYHLGRQLARKIKASGYHPDLVIAIGRGGYVPARVVCDFLLEDMLTSIKIEHYGSAADKREKTIIRFPLVADAAGKNVLIVDDLTDTGDTLALAVEYLRSFHPLDVRTAVLQHKATSPYTPDYYVEYVADWKWIVYPWALHEDLVGFARKVLAAGPATPGEIREEMARAYDLGAEEDPLADALEDLVTLGVARKDGSRYRLLPEG